MKRFIVIFTVLLSLSSAAEVAEDKVQKSSPVPTNLRVDRPSYANSSFTIGKKMTSLESGVLVIVNKGTPDALTQTPMLIRHGISDTFELRLATSGLNNQNSLLGWADAASGFKWNFHSSDDISASLVGSLTVPLGNPTFRPTSLNPSLSVAIDIPVGPKTGVLFNVGAATSGAGSVRVLQPFTTIGVGQTLSDRWSLYIEGAAFGATTPDGPATTAGDVVATYLISPDLQLDTAFFKGFSSSGLNWATTLGLSTRF